MDRKKFEKLVDEIIESGANREKIKDIIAWIWCDGKEKGEREILNIAIARLKGIQEDR